MSPLPEGIRGQQASNAALSYHSRSTSHDLNINNHQSNDPTTPTGSPIPNNNNRTPAGIDDLATSFGSERQPARSYFYSSIRDSPDLASQTRSSLNVRRHTAELASLALGGSYTESPPLQQPQFPQRRLSYSHTRYPSISHEATLIERSDESSVDSSPIHGTSPASSHENNKAKRVISPPSGQSNLTNLIKSSPPETRNHTRPQTPEEDNDDMGQTSSSTSPLLSRKDGEPDHKNGRNGRRNGYGAIQEDSYDPEAQGRHEGFKRKDTMAGKFREALAWPQNEGMNAFKKLVDKELWSKENVWQKGVKEPISFLPAVLLGLLLNVLDGLSYGLILFPLGEPLFSSLGPDGLSMFYVSCIVSQLVYSLGGSAFPGGVGSEMIEVVPFFHKMAYTIMNQVGKENEKAVLATTILAFAVSSIITGLVFFLLGTLKLGSLIGFFPRHILVGCIGGVGWFLIVTALEVCAHLDGSLTYTLDTLKHLFDPLHLAMWGIPCLLAIILMTIQHFIKHPMVVPLYFLAVPIIFYIVVLSVPSWHLENMRDIGWIFEMPEAGVPFWHFYTLYDFRAVDWKALFSTIPAMFALTFFGILHVPINVPALAISTQLDDLNLDRELRAHGISNALSGMLGSIQNYLVYTNSLLFVRCGGNSRVAGFMLALGTAGIMVVGPVLIGYIPVMVVGALIFLLGFELLREALWDTWGKLQWIEYVTVFIIVVTMGAWDFVYGILIGILLACVSYVIQTSRVSAIRASYSGVVARSTVRRNPVQQRFLRNIGHQIRVVKLSGYMFFGTIASVEAQTKALLDEKNDEHKPIRYLILDFGNVSGLDFSAAEAFTRMRRTIETRNVEMILSGVEPHSKVGKSLRSVGVWNDKSPVPIFSDLNAALESCENEFLSAFYERRDQVHPSEPDQTRQQPIPSDNNQTLSPASVYGTTPRSSNLLVAVRTTLKEEGPLPLNRYASLKEPLPLILQTFEKSTDKNEDFWFRLCRYLRRIEVPANTTLFRVGDTAKSFYILESGILRCEYELEQGDLTECIVAGTTCGELPFFSETSRTATVTAERDSVAWELTNKEWETIKKEDSELAAELLTVSMKLTTERMGALTSYVLTCS